MVIVVTAHDREAYCEVLQVLEDARDEGFDVDWQTVPMGEG